MVQFTAIMSWIVSILFIPPVLLAANNMQVTIIETASTNVPGIAVTYDSKCNAVADERDRGGNIVHAGATQSKPFILNSQLCDQFNALLKNVPSVQNIPVRNDCMKSASFGTSIFIEKEGKRSPDISCADDPHTRALWEKAGQIVQAARAATGIGKR